jgi:hypothetical protein
VQLNAPIGVPFLIPIYDDKPFRSDVLRSLRLTQGD